MTGTPEGFFNKMVQLVSEECRFETTWHLEEYKRYIKARIFLWEQMMKKKDQGSENYALFSFKGVVSIGRTVI